MKLILEKAMERIQMKETKYVEGGEWELIEEKKRKQVVNSTPTEALIHARNHNYTYTHTHKNHTQHTSPTENGYNNHK